VILDRFFVSDDVVSLLDHEFLRSNEVMPLFVEGSILHLAMVDPLDTDLIEQIEEATGLKAEVSVCSRAGFKHCTAVNLQEGSGGSLSGVNDDLVAAGCVLRSLLFEMNSSNCSELHLDGKGGGMSIRMGRGRKLRIIDPSAMKITGDQLPSLRQYLGLNGKRNSPVSGDLCIVHVGREELSIRVSILETLQGESLVFKPVDRNLYLGGLSGAGIKGNQYQECEKLLGHNHGLIVISSPPGNGKTVTMYAMLKHLSDQGRSIYLLEDSVLDVLDYACQVPVEGFDGSGLAVTLDRVQKHSPDVIAVGECPDSDTLSKLLNFGRNTLVITTMIAHDFAETWFRVTSRVEDTELVSSEFIGGVSQVLLRPFCRDCFDEVHSEGRDECPVCGSYGTTPPSPVFQVVSVDSSLRAELESCYDSSSVDNVLKVSGIQIMSEVIRGGNG